MPKLALRRVIVQPEFVLIDGDQVTDVPHPAIAIPAEDWPAYSSQRFPAEVKAWQAQIDIEAEKATAPAVPNRATRRAKPRKA